MQAAMDYAVKKKEWEHAAVAAGNLSESHLSLGDIHEALEFGEKSVGLADKSGDEFQRMYSRTTLADARHQAGEFSEAERLFQDAKRMQKERQPEFPLLYSLRGFQYCELLLGQGQFMEVQGRAKKFFEWREPTDPLLDIALDQLSLGRAFLAQAVAESDDFGRAAEYLDQAVEGLRKSGQQDELPRGLIARAELRRHAGSFSQARQDLDEALDIARDGELRLLIADACLEFTRLFLALGERVSARERLAEAEELIRVCGYGRRREEAAELRGELGE